MRTTPHSTTYSLLFSFSTLLYTQIACEPFLFIHKRLFTPRNPTTHFSPSYSILVKESTDEAFYRNFTIIHVKVLHVYVLTLRTGTEMYNSYHTAAHKKQCIHRIFELFVHVLQNVTIDCSTTVHGSSLLLLKPQVSSGMCRWRDGSGRGWLGVTDTRLCRESRPELETVNK